MFEPTDRCARQIETVAALLLGLGEGQLLPYHDILHAIGENDRERARHVIDRARKRVEEEKGWVLAVVLDQGIKREVPAHANGVLSAATRKIARAARRTLKRAKNWRNSPLSRRDRAELDMRVAHLGVIGTLARKRKFAKDEAPEPTQPALPA